MYTSVNAWVARVGIWHSQFTLVNFVLCYYRRKRVGVLATEHWGSKYPKFNTPERKAVLDRFAAKISEECSLPDAGFNEQGIQQHIKDLFSEQRRYVQRKNVSECISVALTF